MSKSKKILGPNESYAALLDRLTSDKLKGNKSTYMPLRPSASGKCTRELGFEYANYMGKGDYKVETIEPRIHRIFSKGHSLEYMLVKHFREAFAQSDKDIQIRYSQQVVSIMKLGNGKYIEGSIDGVFVSDDFRVLIDYKTKGDKFSSWSKTKWTEDAAKLAKNPHVEQFCEQGFYVDDLEAFLDDLNDPFLAMNFYQLNLYFFDENEFLKTRGIDHAALIYLNKNSSEVREIRFRPSKAIAEYVKSKFKNVHDTISETGDPMRLSKDFTLGSAKCAFCSFNTHCYPGKDALKDYFKTFPKKSWPKDTSYLKKELDSELETLYTDYKNAEANCDQKTKLEVKIVKILDENRIQKVRFRDGSIYELKTLKSGGVGGGPRLVLRKGKL